jgi:TetR/AcrR family transcriptional regulator, upper aerobic nicotinate degradation pathway regulator
MTAKNPLAPPGLPRKASNIRKTGKVKPTVGTQARALQTREAIVRAAISVFSKSGFEGGRIETISKLAQTHDRLIYYYFGSKEALFVEVLKTVYKRMNDAETTLQIDITQPASSLVSIVDFTWNYYLDHPELITLLNTENLHEGKHLKKAQRMSALVSPALGMLDRILEAGATRGLFRRDLRARDVYIAIASLGYFYLSNRHTLSAFLDEDLLDKAALTHWRGFIADVILRMVQAAPEPSKKTASPKKRGKHPVLDLVR